MIYKALMLIKMELQKYMKPFLAKGDQVLLGNIALMDTDLDVTQDEKEKLHKNIIMTLTRVEEEAILKNVPHYAQDTVNQKTVYKNPPTPLNLFLLFTAGTGASTIMEDYYGTSMKYLSHIIKFFQGKNVFSNRNTPVSSPLETADEELESFELIMDLYSPSFEEANYMWSTLGGRQLPHACYKLRLVQLEREMKQEERGVVKEITLMD